MSKLPEDLQQRITEYIEGELPPADAARLEVYLANSDAQLAKEVVGMLSDRQAVRALPRTSAPRELSARIMEQIERASLLHNVDEIAVPQRPWWQSRGMIAASALILLGGFSYLVVTSVLSPRGGHNKAPQALAVGNPAVLSPAKVGEAAGAKEVDQEGGALAMAKPKDAVTDFPLAPATAPSDATAAPKAAADDRVATELSAGTQVASANNIPSPVDQVDSMIGGAAAGGPGATAAPGGAGGGFGGGGGGGVAGGFRAGRGGFGGTGAAPSGGAMPLGAQRGGGGGGAGGGGGRMGGRSPAIAMADATATLDSATSESAAKALETLAQTPSALPIVVTLYARDSQDAGKIAATLDSYNAANNRDSGSQGQSSVKAFNLAQSNGSPVMNNAANWAGTRQGNNESQQNLVTNGQFSGGNAYATPGPFHVALRSDQLRDLAGQFRVALVARGEEVHLFNQMGNLQPATADNKQRADLLARAGLDEAPSKASASAMHDALAQATTAAAEVPSAAATSPAAFPMRENDNRNGQTAAQDGVNAIAQSQPVIEPMARRMAVAGPAAPAVALDKAAPAWIDCVITIEAVPGEIPATSAPAPALAPAALPATQP